MHTCRSWYPATGREVVEDSKSFARKFIVADRSNAYSAKHLDFTSHLQPGPALGIAGPNYKTDDGTPTLLSVAAGGCYMRRA